MMPTGVESSFNSVRMRHRTGKAVMAMATPMNSKKVPYAIGFVPGSSLNCSYMPYDIAAPRENGMIRPTELTLSAIFQLLKK
jgi:hypothetical protein